MDLTVRVGKLQGDGYIRPWLKDYDQMRAMINSYNTMITKSKRTRPLRDQQGLRGKMAVPWLRKLGAGLSRRRPWSAPRVSLCGICGGRSGNGSVLRLFTCLYHSNLALHDHMSSGGWTVGPLLAAVQRHSLTSPTWTSATTGYRITFIRILKK
jgi:hypothetical protein